MPFLQNTLYLAHFNVMFRHLFAVKWQRHAQNTIGQPGADGRYVNGIGEAEATPEAAVAGFNTVEFRGVFGGFGSFPLTADDELAFPEVDSDGVFRNARQRQMQFEADFGFQHVSGWSEGSG